MYIYSNVHCTFFIDGKKIASKVIFDTIKDFICKFFDTSRVILSRGDSLTYEETALSAVKFAQFIL